MAKTKKTPPGPMTKLQEFWLEHNPDVPDARAAVETGATPGQVRMFRKKQASRPAEPGVTAFTAMLDKQRPGVVAMTGEAAALGDEISRRGAVTQDQIDRAVAARDYTLAEQLTRLWDEHRRNLEAETRANNAGRWHYIK